MKSLVSKKIKKFIKWMLILFVVFKIIVYTLGRFEMKNVINNKSGIKVSIFFKILENDVFHTPNAFDSDYTWNYKLKISETNYKSISNQIESSKFYNSRGWSNLAEPIYDSLSIYGLKGFWTGTDEKYEFHPSKEEWAESTNIEILKSDKTIDVYLVHL